MRQSDKSKTRKEKKIGELEAAIQLKTLKSILLHTQFNSNSMQSTLNPLHLDIKKVNFPSLHHESVPPKPHL